LLTFFIRINAFLNLCIYNKLFARSWGGDTSENLSVIFNYILTLLLCIFNFFFQLFQLSLLEFISIFS
jgi:hypothetical protein